VKAGAKLALGAAIAAGLGSIAATIWIGASVREDTVVARPYEEGLRHGQGAGAAEGCDLADGPCTRRLAVGEVTVEVAPRPPRTMTELAVRVALRAEGAPAPPADVIVAFSMPGMEMGENRARLAATGAGRWEGKAVLVRCPSGKRGWVAQVRLGGADAARFALTVDR
jgi:hypothetical protein